MKIYILYFLIFIISFFILFAIMEELRFYHDIFEKIQEYVAGIFGVILMIVIGIGIFFVSKSIIIPIIIYFFNFFRPIILFLFNGTIPQLAWFILIMILLIFGGAFTVIWFEFTFICWASVAFGGFILWIIIKVLEYIQSVNPYLK